MKILRLTALSLAMVALAGCGSMGPENKRVDYKSDAAKVPSLEIPPDLTVPSSEDHYIIPEDGAATASYSAFARDGSTPRSTAVLPESRIVHLEHDGAKRWLLVNDRAENIWPTIKAFWQENGFAIKTDDPQAGVIETDWAENRAKIPRTGLRSLLGKVFDGLYDSGEKDRYVVRLERSKDGASTLVYITQYGKEEVLSADKSTSVWQSRPNDPELEATMLQMLMAKLGGSEAHAKTSSVSTQALSDSAQTLPEQITAVAPKLQTLSDGNKSILLSEPFDRSWRIVGLALERAGYAIEDKDRTSGVYYLRARTKDKGWLDKLAFWRSDEAPQRPQVVVREGDSGCEVTANDGTGASDENTQQLIDSLYKALGK